MSSVSTRYYIHPAVAYVRGALRLDTSTPLADHAPDLATARERLAIRRGLEHLFPWAWSENRFG